MRNASHCYWTKNWTGNLLLLAGALLLIFLLVGAVKEFRQRKELSTEIAKRQTEINRLIGERDKAMEEIKNFQTSFFAEQEARIKFNLKRPGEKVAVIALSSAANDSESAIGGKQLTNYGVFGNVIAWWSYFFGI